MTERYSDFITEAFIAPLRSVLIVDDDYPTFDEILRAQHSSNKGHKYATDKDWPSQPDKLMAIIGRFRQHDPPLLVDIHDGQNVGQESEQSNAEHLHQSDLLILDYELDKAQPGDGSRAIQVLRHLMKNHHFNLVVVYTKENLDTVFQEILLGLLGPSYEAPPLELANEIVDALEAAEDHYFDVAQKLSDSIGSAQYLYSRCFPKKFSRVMTGRRQPYSEFAEVCEKAEIDPRFRRDLLRFYLSEFERSNHSKMNSRDSADTLVWSTTSVKWLKGDSIFVAFSNKSEDDDLLCQLQVALHDWNPNPSRLLLAKIRAAMDEYGAVAQTEALTYHHALAAWYFKLMVASESERRSRIAESVVRHSDHLMHVILPRVEEFTNRLIRADTDSGDIEERCRYHFKVDPSDARDRQIANLQHNALVCSHEPTGWHLTTGHIFRMSDSYWLCLSAACDMVPAQIPQWRQECFGQRLPFIAVKLHPRKKMPSDVQSNLYLFVRIDGDVSIFSFNSSGEDDSKPHWELFFAENSGEFPSDEFGVFDMENRERCRDGGTYGTRAATTNCETVPS